jgi:hypothetical protein
LQKFPDFDPSWSDELKAKWFDSFEELQRRSSRREDDEEYE